MTNFYATDGKCHNAEPGTYGHECGKPAEWIGEHATGFRAGFCDDCREHGYEARGIVLWERIQHSAAPVGGSFIAKADDCRFHSGELSFEQAYRLADNRMDAGDEDAARLLNFCAGSAEEYKRMIEELLWGMLEKNGAKRRSKLLGLRHRLEKAGISFPFGLCE